MKALNLLFVITVFILLFSGCQNQEPQKVLLTIDNSGKLKNAVSPVVYTKTFSMVAENENAIPVKCTWKVVRDTVDKCLKVSDLKLERTGGKSSIVADEVTYKIDENCITEPKDSTRFQRVNLFCKFNYRNWLLYEVIGQSVEVDATGKLKYKGNTVN